MRTLNKPLFQPVDGASVFFFRVCLGFIMVWEVIRYFYFGWITHYYIEPSFFFKYYGFSWVEPWPGIGMYVHFLVVGLLALCVALGCFYRITSLLLFLGFTYWYLLDQTNYLNHFYLTALLLFLMCFIPAHRGWSIDARYQSKPKDGTIPFWCLLVLRIQVGIPYFYGGIAKLNEDWLRGEPIRDWLLSRSDYPILGPWFTTESAVWFYGYGGLLFDLLIVPFLLWKRTRIAAFCFCLFFHGMNKWLFNIGIFPLLMLAATTLFFEPDWPRRCWNRIQERLFKNTSKDRLPSSQGAFTPPKSALPPKRPLASRLLPLAIYLYICFQLLFPLRHFLYPGSVHWTEEGHLFAWHMKLRSKKAMATFTATDPQTGKSWQIDKSQYLSPRQEQDVGKWPDLCLQFAHHLAQIHASPGQDPLEIRAVVYVSLNSRPFQDLIDPDIDLTKVKRDLCPKDWIVPLEEH